VARRLGLQSLSHRPGGIGSGWGYHSASYASLPRPLECHLRMLTRQPRPQRARSCQPGKRVTCSVAPSKFRPRMMEPSAHTRSLWGGTVPRRPIDSSSLNDGSSQEPLDLHPYSWLNASTRTRASVMLLNSST